MVEANAVLQVADGVPDFSVAAMVGLQVQSRVSPSRPVLVGSADMPSIQ